MSPRYYDVRLLEKKLPYGWVHTHPNFATRGRKEKMQIDELCHHLGRARVYSPEWELRRAARQATEYPVGYVWSNTFVKGTRKLAFPAGVFQWSLVADAFAPSGANTMVMPQIMVSPYQQQDWTYNPAPTTSAMDMSQFMVNTLPAASYAMDMSQSVVNTLPAATISMGYDMPMDTPQPRASQDSGYNSGEQQEAVAVPPAAAPESTFPASSPEVPGVSSDTTPPLSSPSSAPSFEGTSDPTPYPYDDGADFEAYLKAERRWVLRPMVME